MQTIIVLFWVFLEYKSYMQNFLSVILIEVDCIFGERDVEKKVRVDPQKVKAV